MRTRFSDLVIPAKAGDPVRRSFSAQSLWPLEYWIVRPSAQLRTRRTMTVECEAAFSRRIAPEVCILVCPLRNQRAQGRPGACCTRGPACDFALTKTAHEHTGQREHSGLPCAMALRLTSCSSRRTALLPPLSLRSFASPGRDASTATSEPHDFAVRFRRARLLRHPRPSHPTARS